MLTSYPMILLVASATGFLAGLGVGGGSLLMLWLTLVLNLSYPAARNINLLFFIPSAIIASVFHWKRGSLNLKRIFPAIISGCISAAVFSYVGKQLDTSMFEKLFGFLLLATGLREIFYKPAKSDHLDKNAR